jgi:hypothetical protein
LKVFQIRVLRTLFVHRSVENFVRRNVKNFSLDEISEDKMGDACSTYGRDEKCVCVCVYVCVYNLVVKPKGRDYVGDLVIEGV